MYKDDLVKLFKKMDDEHVLLDFGEELIARDISVVQYKLIDSDFVMNVYGKNSSFFVYKFVYDNLDDYYLKEIEDDIEINLISINKCYNKYLKNENVNNIIRFGAFLKTNNINIISNILKKVDIST